VAETVREYDIVAIQGSCGRVWCGAQAVAKLAAESLIEKEPNGIM
jgi:hypothetical protein